MEPLIDWIQDVGAWVLAHWVMISMAILRVIGLANVPGVLLERRGAPIPAIGWIVGLVTAPLVTLPLWWLVGRRRLERKRRKRRRHQASLTPRLTRVRDALPAASGLNSALVPFRKLPGDLRYSVFAPTDGNEIDLLPDPNVAYEAMEAAIRSAKAHVHLLFYIWRPDETGKRFRDLLIKKAQEGVEVRALFDAWGSSRLDRRFLEPFKQAGVQHKAFLPTRLFARTPLLHFRNHRKLLIIDGHVGFTGGINIGDEHLDGWHDFGIRIAGPAVHQLQETFSNDWYFASGEDLADSKYFNVAGPSLGRGSCALIASGPDAQYAAIRDVLFSAVNRTQRSLRVMTPYFIPDVAMLAAIRSAIYRGVEVHLQLPGRSDVALVKRASQAYYRELLELGVHIYEYQAGILHGKAALFDDHLAMVGSANFDIRSFQLNFEASCMIADADFTKKLAAYFARTQESSRSITLREVRMRPRQDRIIDAAANLLAPLL
jgi:cardiolipin synthase A/B